jgi:hypothetical protein
MLARQAMQNPHAGDGYATGDGGQDKRDKPYTLPMVGATPKEVLIAGAVGGPIGLALNLLSDNAIGHAQAIENWWGVRHVNGLLDKTSAPHWLAKQDWWRQFDYYPEISAKYPELITKFTETGKTPVQAHTEAIQTIKEEVMQSMKERHLKVAQKAFNSRLQSHWGLTGRGVDATEAYQKLIHEELKAGSSTFAKLEKTHRIGLLEKLGLNREAAEAYLEQAEPKTLFDEMKAAFEKIKLDPTSANLSDAEKISGQLYHNAEALGIKTSEDFAKRCKISLPDLSKPVTGHSFEQVLDGLHTKIEYLETKGALAPAENKVLGSLRALRDRMSCSQSMGHYEQKALLHAEMRAARLKPLGRVYAQFWSQLRSLFGGEAAIGGLINSAQRGLGGRLFGAIFGSMFMVAPAVHAATEAKKGEKKAAFFENFIGFGLFNMFGWEVGRHLLNSTKLVEKLLGRHAIKHPFSFLKYVPVIGEGLGRKVGGAAGPVLGGLLGNNPIGRWFGRMTAAGLITELIAMFIFGNQFQKIGEWLSHKIFGKPTPKEPDGKNKPPAAPPPGFPAPAGTPGAMGAMPAGLYPAGGSGYPSSLPPPMPYASAPAAPLPSATGGYHPPTGVPMAGQGFPPSMGGNPLPPGMQEVLTNPLYQQSTNAVNYFNRQPPGSAGA